MCGAVLWLHGKSHFTSRRRRFPMGNIHPLISIKDVPQIYPLIVRNFLNLFMVTIAVANFQAGNRHIACPYFYVGGFSRSIVFNTTQKLKYVIVVFNC